MVSIRITSTPRGEMPEAIRRAWTGLILPAQNKELGSYLNTVDLRGYRKY